MVRRPNAQTLSTQKHAAYTLLIYRLKSVPLNLSSFAYHSYQLYSFRASLLPIKSSLETHKGVYSFHIIFYLFSRQLIYIAHSSFIYTTFCTSVQTCRLSLSVATTVAFLLLLTTLHLKEVYIAYLQ